MSSFSQKLQEMADAEATALCSLPEDERQGLVQEAPTRKHGHGRPACGPKGWPNDILYLESNDLSNLSSQDKKLVRPGASARIPGIEIRKITDPGHPACGQVSTPTMLSGLPHSSPPALALVLVHSA
jgi:hypothetical protein